MGSTNFGNQIKTFDYFQEGKSEGFNKLLYSVLPTGIISGGTLTKITNSSISISPLICQIEDTTRKISLRVETQDSITLSVSTATPYIICRLDWLNIENNYMDVVAISDTDVESGDLILGKCEFLIAELTGFDYSKKSTNPLVEINNNKKSLYLESNEPFDNRIYINPGSLYINNKYISYAGGQSPTFNITSTDPRIDLICINDSGVISIVEGTPSSTPAIPTMPDNLLSLGHVTIPSNTDPIIIKGSYITNYDPSRYFRQGFEDLAGSGRTTETVKGNSDRISPLESWKATIDGFANTYTSASRNSVQEIADSTETIIIYDDEISDPGNNYNSSTGIYTIPSTGTYAIGGGSASDDVAWTVNKIWRLSLNVNGTAVVYIGSAIAQTSFTGVLACIGSLPVYDFTIGQSVGLSIQQDRGSSTNTRADSGYNYFIIKRIA